MDRRRLAAAAIVAANVICFATMMPAQTQPPRASRPTLQIGTLAGPHHATPQQKAEAKRLATALIYASLLLLIFVVASWALLRFTRHYRTYLIRGKRAATPSEDVWAMHRPPPEEMWPQDESDEEPLS